MRVAPLGAWYADDIDKTMQQAILSAEVTHAHPEGQAGAVAIALAAGWAWRWNQEGRRETPESLLAFVAGKLPDSEVRAGVERAHRIPLKTWPFDVANELGCGHQVTAQDTVPFCLWAAALHLGEYTAAMWTTARVGGDIDTNCAIVGGIVALSAEPAAIPDAWRQHREPLQW
jgi:ADP-ribosylglycohydrolase